MGSQSTPSPSRRRFVPLRLAALHLFFCLLPHSFAQTLATTVPLIFPSALVFDTTGNLYFAEQGSHLIRRVDTSGVITTVAGTGTQGFSGDDGPAAAAQLDSPQGLAITPTSLYIADTHNHRIRKIVLATGIMTTIAGTTVGFGGDSGAAISAHLGLPTALTVDSAGNLYLADTANHRIRKITLATGIISTLAGNGTQGYSGDVGPAVNAAIDSPQGLAVNGSGDIFLADTHNHRVRKITASSGIITTVAGMGTVGRSLTQLALPHGLTIDATGNLYLADTANHRILRVDSVTGLATTFAGTGTQSFSGDAGSAALATLNSPTNVALSSASQVTLADTGNQRIRQVSADSGLQTIAGLGATTPGVLTLTAPAVIAYGTGQLTAALTSSTTATGTITVLDSYTPSTQTIPIGTTFVSNAIVGNHATLSTSTLAVGTHTLVATYSGDLTHSSAQSPALTIGVTKAATVTTILVPSSLDSPIAFKVVVVSTTTGNPTGTLALLEAANPVGVATLDGAGVATFQISEMAPGPHTLTAAYAGDTNFQPSTSAAASFTVGTSTTADFTLTATGTTNQTVAAGSPSTFTFLSQTTGNLSSPITLVASGLPPGATATFNPNFIPPGQSSGSFTLTVTSLKPSIKASAAQIPLVLAGLLLPFLMNLPRLRYKRQVLLSLLVFSLMNVTGCGARINTGANAQTSSPNYTITVTGTATNALGAILTHSSTVTLTIQ